jgi:hypothetical protein
MFDYLTLQNNLFNLDSFKLVVNNLSFGKVAGWDWRKKEGAEH